MHVRATTEGEPDAWLESLNILLINARSLINFERRFKFKNAVLSNEYNVICVTETWLNDKIDTSELLLDDYTVYRSDRTISSNQSAHDGVFFAVKNYIESNIHCNLWGFELPNNKPDNFKQWWWRRTDIFGLSWGQLVSAGSQFSDKCHQHPWCCFLQELQRLRMWRLKFL